jgi:hypothetical protein
MVFFILWLVEIDIDLNGDLFILFVVFSVVEAVIFIFNDVRVVVGISLLFVVYLQTYVHF